MDNPLPKWHVDGSGIHQETTLAASGTGLAEQWIVPYIIDEGPAKGTTHTVAVAPRDFTAAGVRQAITESLNSVHGVASLSGGHA